MLPEVLYVLTDMLRHDVYSAFSIYRGKCPGEEIAIYRNIAIYNLIVKYSTVFRKVIENKFKELKTVQYIHNVVSV